VTCCVLLLLTEPTPACRYQTIIGGGGFIALLIYVLVLCVVLFTDEVRELNGLISSTD
jgi:hypothetical protein